MPGPKPPALVLSEFLCSALGLHAARMLKNVDLQGRRSNDPQPRSVPGWLTVEHDAHFDDGVQHLCGLYEQAQALEAAGEVALTSDEMTEVQALERLHLSNAQHRLAVCRVLQPGVGTAVQVD